jgi:hypothetical protein
MATRALERAGGGRGLWLRWVLANIFGFTAGGAIAGTIARAMGQSHYGVATSMAEAVLISTRTACAATAVFGAAVGTAQWLVIRGRLRPVGWWVPATSAGWALADVVAGILSGAMGGAVTGIGRGRGTFGKQRGGAMNIGRQVREEPLVVPDRELLPVEERPAKQRPARERPAPEPEPVPVEQPGR